ncbi:aspartyl-phosphate phosphatase Spo0E family protein [Maledivibacter halophilus]|uniref:Spo0E like sporulation regulatory protein n=1 Tax=Maledivibacter halophilus TaxID=36842 RepID=A0A1T5LSW6_9FIRM|nr:aspartyl-phosphate phosphatase Spo0E family protein [Maledivibacter halophilus]SKC78984.1 Spo0E like sporulation regulatory protein [Maledivibacter halophilus]
MKKSKNNEKVIKRKMEELRLALNKIYVERGNDEEVVKISQELDDYIVSEQKKKKK